MAFASIPEAIEEIRAGRMLIVVDDEDRLRGLFTMSDIERITQERGAQFKPARDGKFRLVCGAALLTGFFAPLALVVLSPIVVVISWFHLTLDPEKWPMGVVLPALMFIAAHGYRTLYLPLLQARPSKG